MRFWIAGAMVLALALPVAAQPVPGLKPAQTQENPERKAQEKKAEEKSYSNSLSRIPDQQKKNDPWEKIR